MTFMKTFFGSAVNHMNPYGQDSEFLYAKALCTFSNVLCLKG